MLGSEHLAEEYIKKYGYRIDANNLKLLRSVSEEVAEIEAPKESSADDPIFTVFLKCPSCLMGNIPSYELKAKSLQILTDKFGMPHYRASGKYQVLDYNLLSVTVCPKCLYASPDKKDFIGRDPARAQEIPARMHQGELAAMLALADERIHWLAQQKLDAMKDLIPRSRTPAAGLASYDLAIKRAEIEFSRNVPFSAYKMAAYYLKQATIAEAYEVNPLVYHVKALRSYLTCFERSNAPGFNFEGQVLYLVIALALKVNKLEIAGSYIGVLEQSKSRADAGLFDPGVVSQFKRWYTAAREVWADREDPDLWVMRKS